MSILSTISSAELTRLREQEAGAAAMRKALQSLNDYEQDTCADSGDFAGFALPIVRAALSPSAGRDLLADVERLRKLRAELEISREYWVKMSDANANEIHRLHAGEERLRAELEEYRGLAELAGATMAVSDRNKLLAEVVQLRASAARLRAAVEQIHHQIVSGNLVNDILDEVAAIVDAVLSEGGAK